MNLRIKQSLPLIPGALPLKSGGAPETRGTRFPHIVGIFGDSYNSKNLVEMCAHYIAANMKESLSQEGWMELKKSPNLMFEIIKSVKEGESNASDLTSALQFCTQGLHH